MSDTQLESTFELSSIEAVFDTELRELMSGIRAANPSLRVLMGKASTKQGHLYCYLTLASVDDATIEPVIAGIDVEVHRDRLQLVSDICREASGEVLFETEPQAVATADELGNLLPGIGAELAHELVPILAEVFGGQQVRRTDNVNGTVSP